MSNFHIAWTVHDYLFVCNLNGSEITRHVTFQQMQTGIVLKLLYSTAVDTDAGFAAGNGIFYTLPALQPDECRIYKLVLSDNERGDRDVM